MAVAIVMPYQITWSSYTDA